LTSRPRRSCFEPPKRKITHGERHRVSECSAGRQGSRHPISCSQSRSCACLKGWGGDYGDKWRTLESSSLRPDESEVELTSADSGFDLFFSNLILADSSNIAGVHHLFSRQEFSYARRNRDS
jgi:hypothetical protein